MPNDIYIVGHSLGGGLAQWVSMLTVDHYQLFGGELDMSTAMRTVTFNPPGMQGIDPNGKAPHYAEIAHTISQHKIASGELATAMIVATPGESLGGATAVLVKKIVELLNYQTAIKNRSIALRMGQGALIFLWDLLMPDRSGLSVDKEINNALRHLKCNTTLY
ncbi:Lipase (class 3) [Piscirickettsia salmonis]|uniref:hypothetical protein n=1 Tax=Piscirickettsia salmonis TaxID=1238 RepID=UPI0012BA73F9|nr:hypothetical protein [Piscirickettsia salmonis]QGP56238.1 Lipase (class 3) [Piscirickettsia salmonis]QGP57891.1 Lipase (class 3) [Piscirickettsia salmonis]QGP65806.1 Lipase (class 3) [Piscirickettsia salmonis]